MRAIDDRIRPSVKDKKMAEREKKGPNQKGSETSERKRSQTVRRNNTIPNHQEQRGRGENKYSEDINMGWYITKMKLEKQSQKSNRCRYRGDGSSFCLFQKGGNKVKNK